MRTSYPAPRVSPTNSRNRSSGHNALSDPHSRRESHKWLISAEKTGGAYGYVPGAAGKPGYDAVGDPAKTDASTLQCTAGVNLANVGHGYDPNACQWP